jgi:hypothetical protein
MLDILVPNPHARAPLTIYIWCTQECDNPDQDPVSPGACGCSLDILVRKLRYVVWGGAADVYVDKD